jgi:hypothetical protein
MRVIRGTWVLNVGIDASFDDVQDEIGIWENAEEVNNAKGLTTNDENIFGILNGCHTDIYIITSLSVSYFQPKPNREHKKKLLRTPSSTYGSDVQVLRYNFG